MPRKAGFFSLLFCMLVMLGAVPVRSAEAGLVQDMVRFDQAYIPVLAVTSDEKLAPARQALARLLPVWTSFKTSHYENVRGDAQWQSSLDTIDRHIKASERIIQQGTRLKDAHEELEHIRFVFMELRVRNGIDYYIDHLTRFHEPMETIVLAAKGKDESTLTQADLDLIRSTLPKAIQLWQQTSASEIDAVLFGFNSQQASALRQLVENETAALQKLQHRLQTGNKKDIISAAVAIKPNFAKSFKLFGRFPAAQ